MDQSITCLTPFSQSLYAIAAAAGCEISFWRPTERGGRVSFDAAALRALIRPGATNRRR